MAPIIVTYVPTTEPTSSKNLLQINFSYGLQTEGLNATDILTGANNNTVINDLIIATETTIIYILNETYPMIIITASPTPFVPKNNAIKTNDKFVIKENNKKVTKNNNDKFISFQTTNQPSESTATSTNTLTITVTESKIKKQQYSGNSVDDSSDASNKSTKKNKYIHHRYLKNASQLSSNSHHKRILAEPQPYYTEEYPIEIINVYDDKCLFIFNSNIKCVIIRSTVTIVLDDNCNLDCEEEIKLVVTNGFRESLNDGSFLDALPSY